MKDSILIEQLTLVNFKGERNKTISFDSKETNIFGDNAVGKTRVFDAFTWLLFGKDSEDRMNYNILLVDNDNILPKVDAEVEGIIVKNGVKTKLKRVFRQKWVRPRGQDTEVLEGNETLFWADGVSVKANEYKVIVNAILSEDIFKLLTSPTYFLSQKWEIQRTILQKMVTPVSDEDIAGLKPEFVELLRQLQGKDAAKFKAELRARISEMKKEKDDIPSRIDQTMKLMPEITDYKPLEAQLAKIDQDIAANKLLAESGQKAIQERFGKEVELQNNISQIKRLQQGVLFQKQIEEQTNVDKQNEGLNTSIQAKQLAETELQKINNNIFITQQNESNISQGIAKLESEKATLTEQYKTVQQSQYNADSIKITCPLFGHECSDAIAIEKHFRDSNDALTNFNNDKLQRLTDITNKGLNLKERIEFNKESLEKSKEVLVKLNADKIKVEKEIESLTNAITSFVKAEAKTFEAKDIPEWVVLNDKIKQIEVEIELLKASPLPSNREYSEKIEVLQVERSTIEIQLSKKDDVAKHQAEIDRLQQRAKEVVKIISDLEKQEFILKDFNKTKIKYFEEMVNKMFSFVRFKMFDYTFDDNEFETCIAINEKGVYISSTNNAEKINAGIDIINTLANFYSITAPIFIDNREGVTKLIESDSQIINLVVSGKDKTLRVE